MEFISSPLELGLALLASSNRIVEVRWSEFLALASSGLIALLSFLGALRETATYGSGSSLPETERPHGADPATTASTNCQACEGGQLRLPAQPTSQLHAVVWVGQGKTGRGTAQSTQRRVRDNTLLLSEDTKCLGRFVMQ